MKNSNKMLNFNLIWKYYLGQGINFNHFFFSPKKIKSSLFSLLSTRTAKILVNGTQIYSTLPSSFGRHEFGHKKICWIQKSASNGTYFLCIFRSKFPNIVFTFIEETLCTNSMNVYPLNPSAKSVSELLHANWIIW